MLSFFFFFTDAGSLGSIPIFTTFRWSILQRAGRVAPRRLSKTYLVLLIMYAVITLFYVVHATRARPIVVSGWLDAKIDISQENALRRGATPASLGAVTLFYVVRATGALPSCLRLVDAKLASRKAAGGPYLYNQLEASSEQLLVFW